MTDLFTAARDLPPRWNGRAVVWGPWDMPTSRFFLCGGRAPERTCCPKCASTSERPHAVGALAHKRATTHQQILDYQAVRKGGLVAYRHLHAFRCTDCRHDQVWVSDRDEWWDLDLADYGDRGSVDPDGRF